MWFFHPLTGMEYERAAHIAREMGRELGEAGEVPIYFYGEAATDPSEKSWPDIRKGEYETLKEKLATPGWGPDARFIYFQPQIRGHRRGSPHASHRLQR